jgi:hypothetical protein
MSVSVRWRLISSSCSGVGSVSQEATIRHVLVSTMYHPGSSCSYPLPNESSSSLALWQSKQFLRRSCKRSGSTGFPHKQFIPLKNGFQVKDFQRLRLQHGWKMGVRRWCSDDALTHLGGRVWTKCFKNVICSRLRSRSFSFGGGSSGIHAKGTLSELEHPQDM